MVTYRRFFAYQWEELLCNIDFPASHQERQPSKEPTSKGVEKAALWLVKCVEIARAAKVLMSSGLAPASEETAKKLAAKHPARSVSAENDHEVSSNTTTEAINLDAVNLFNVVKRLPRGSSAGPSGWRYEHIQALSNSLITSDHLHAVCAAIASGSLPISIRPLLSSSRLIALPKANGDVRPIAIGETWRRVTARAICFQKRKEFADYFTPLQHGVSVEGGAELLVQQVQLLMENMKTGFYLKLM